MSLDQHHLKTYTIFFVISLLLILILLYLYTPSVSSSQIQSNILESEEQKIISREVGVSAEVTIDAIAARRIRFTNLLLSYQADIRNIEITEALTPAEKEREIKKLKTKIDNLQKKIEELAK